MKAFINTLLTILAAALVFAGCDEAKGPAYVYGSAAINPGGSDNNINGELAKSSGSKYYGYCDYSDGEFSFMVGHAEADALDDVIHVPAPLNINFTGVTGSGPGGGPEIGVYDATTGQPKTGEGFHGGFARASVAATDIFNFTNAEGNCVVELFAEAVEGELIWDITKDFEYYVRIRCDGMTDVTGTNTGAELQTVALDFYFDNC